MTLPLGCSTVGQAKRRVVNIESASLGARNTRRDVADSGGIAATLLGTPDLGSSPLLQKSQ